jgi:DNA uptake protein ComE-like DNA-binding protein
MKYVRSQFIFNKSQRTGIFSLVLIILGLLFVFHFFDFTEESVFDLNSKEIIAMQRDLDSIREAEMKSKNENVYKFNPNFIDDHKGYLLGMTTEEIDRLLVYRDKGLWINSSVEFQKITKISDSLLNVLTPLFKFPEWVNSKPKNRSFKLKKKKPYDQKLDFNKATSEQLQEVYGIGKKLSKRIIDYRSRLGGFTSNIQLYHVYGLDDGTIDRLLNEFTVKTPKSVSKMNVNSASASDLSTIPGVSFELAKGIWEYRVLHDSISSFSELRKIEGMTERKLELIQLYLSLE